MPLSPGSGHETPAVGPDEELKRRARDGLERASRLLIPDDELCSALGLSEDYFSRFRAVVIGTRKARKGYDRLINLRVVTAIEGICLLVERSGRMPSERAEDYVRSVLTELNSLPSNARHSLFTIQPPLEVDQRDVRWAVIRAARRGVRFDYCVPGTDAIEKGFEVLTDPSDSEREEARGSKALERELQARITKCKQVFAWMENVTARIQRLMADLHDDSRELDIAEGTAETPRSYLKALEEKVKFWQMRWLWLSFNEKVVWISKGPDDNREHIIRKEILSLDVRTADSSMPGDSQDRWHRVRYPIDPLILESLLRTCREAELKWKESKRA